VTKTKTKIKTADEKNTVIELHVSRSMREDQQRSVIERTVLYISTSNNILLYTVTI